MPVRVQQQLLDHFVAGTTARTAAQLVGVQVRTAVVFFQRLRRLIASKQGSFLLSGEIALDNRCVRRGHGGRRRRWAAEHQVVFGLFMQGDKVCTAILPDGKAEPLTPVVQANVTPDSLVYTDCFDAHDVLDVSEFQHHCVKPSKTVLSKSGYHINATENFWNQSRQYLRRFNGIRKSSLYCFLKECEWRFNGSGPQTLSTQLKVWYQSEIHEP